MAVVAVTTTMAAGVLYTHTTDTSIDWNSVPNDTYFLDLESELIYYKNSAGEVIGAYDTVVTDGSTVTGDGTSASPLIVIGGGQSGTQLLSGAASYSGTGLTFDVSALTYLIDGTQYATTATQVTLSNGDPSNSRFDAIVADSSQVVSVVQGTPAVTPSTPTIGPDQVLVQYILVGTNATTPNITTEYVYREGSSPDWTGATNGTNNTAVFDSTTPTPFQGTECVLAEVGQYGWNRGVGFVAPSPISRSAYTILSFRIQITEDLVAAGVDRFYVFGWAETAFSNYATRIGYKRIEGLIDTTASAIGSWQLVNIPVFAFTMLQQNTTIGGLWFSLYPNRAGNAPAEFALDDIKFQTGYGPSNNIATIDILKDDQPVGDTSRLNFKDTDSVAVTVTDDTLTNKIDVEFDATDNFKFLKTSVCRVTTAAVNDYAIVSLANSTTFGLVEYNATSPSTLPTTHIANIQFNRPTDDSNYVRISVEMSIKTSAAGELVHCGLHHTPSTTATPTYGWETIGIADNNDVSAYHITFDIPISNILDWAGNPAASNDLCFFFLMLTSSDPGTDVYIGRQWALGLSATNATSPGPITFTAYEVKGSMRDVNPDYSPPS